MKNKICRVNFEFVDSKRSASIANKEINADNCPIQITVIAEQTAWEHCSAVCRLESILSAL